MGVHHEWSSTDPTLNRIRKLGQAWSQCINIDTIIGPKD